MISLRPLSPVLPPVSRLCFGCEQLGGTDWGVFDVSETVAAVQRALELGINFFDTADVYGLGESERRLADALGDARHDLVIATKGGVAWEYGPDARARTRTNCDPTYIAQAVENSLQRLRLERLPLYQLHRYDTQVPLTDTLGALAMLIDAGKVAAVGYSNFPLDALRVAHAQLPAASVQISYNLLDHNDQQPVVDFCQTHGIPVLAYGPLAQGLLSGKYDRTTVFDTSDRRHRVAAFRDEKLDRHLALIDRLRVWAQDRELPIASVALRWVLDAPGITCVITGVKTRTHLEHNIATEEWTLTPVEWVELASFSER